MNTQHVQKAPSTEAIRRFGRNEPQTYRVMVAGALDPEWSDRLGGMRIGTLPIDASEPTITVLEGFVQDQAQLSGVLNTLYNLRLPLLRVELITNRSQSMAKKKKVKVKANDKVKDPVAANGEPKQRMSKKAFEKELERLQIELCRLQEWVKQKGLRVVVVFEGRDAAGKGGVIKRITERVSPRVFRVVATPTPTEREKSQRYIPHFPAAGEVILFDRSWYNRAGVEHVMGFCTEDEYERFLHLTPAFEQNLVDNGIILIKYFFDVSQEVQEERFAARATDPRKHWKLSPMDLESWARWWDYTAAYDAMIKATDSEHAPWHRVRADDKRSARLNCITHLLSTIPYKEIPYKEPPLPKRRKRGKNVPDELDFAHQVPEIY